VDLAPEAVCLKFQEVRKMDLSKLSDWELLKRHVKLEVELERELRRREILRTANNLIGEIAEHLFCTAYTLERMCNSQAGFDAIDPTPDKLKYQVKARRIIRDNSNSRQLSAIRGIKEPKHFDFLAGVLFKADYSLFRAALIPYKVVLKLVRPDEHVNGHRLLLLNDIWEISEVKDVTDKLRAVWH
jgi:hypothetical protein